MALRRWHQVAIGVGTVAFAIFILALISATRGVVAERNATAVAAIGTAHVNHILAPRDFEPHGTEIGPDLAVMGQPTVVVLSVGASLRAIDQLDSSRPRIREIEVVGNQPQTFTLDSDGAMLAVVDGYFGILNKEGQIVHGVPLPPFEDTRLASSSHGGAVYVFGGAQRNYRLYRFIDDGTLQILLEAEEPIIAVADNTNSIYAATAATIMRIKAGAPDMIFKAPADFTDPIRSVAVTDDDVVIFSTDKKVYAMLGSNAVSIVNNAGGILCVRNDMVYVLDRQRQILFSISPASAKLFSEIRP